MLEVSVEDITAVKSDEKHQILSNINVLYVLH